MMTSLLLAAALAAKQPATVQHDFSKMNVCSTVSGTAIAGAFRGTLTETRPFSDKTFARCTYFIALPAGKTAFTVYLQPASDFEELRKFIEEPTKPVNGIGDGAYIFRDSGDGRYKIYVLKRGDLMVQATADSEASTTKLGRVVAGLLWQSSK